MDDAAGCLIVVAVLVVLVWAAVVWTLVLAAFVAVAIVVLLAFLVLLPSVIEGAKMALRRERDSDSEH